MTLLSCGDRGRREQKVVSRRSAESSRGPSPSTALERIADVRFPVARSERPSKIGQKRTVRDSVPRRAIGLAAATRCHSYRKAESGSIVVARRAGTYTANIAAAVNATAASA